ncbi:MAG: HDIG domain-containing protein [Chloroflexi bacterium]|nr:HDIG domain-containing protein [Chloroflexota bacterium]
MIAGDPSLKQFVTLTRWQRVIALGIGALAAAALAAIFAFQPAVEPLHLAAGQASPQTILAPDRLSFPSEIQTRDAHLKAQAQVKDVYDAPDARLAREQVRLASRLFDHVESVRLDSYNPSDRKLAWIATIPGLGVPSSIVSRTLMLDDAAYRRVVNETLYVLDVTMREEIRPGDVPTQTAKLASRVSLALPTDQAEAVTQWAKSFIIPNSFYNAQKTEEERALARARVGTITRTLEKGEAIVRQGEIVTPLAFEAISETDLLNTTTTPADYLGPAAFALILVALLAMYLARLRPAVIKQTRALWLIAFLVVLFALVARIVAQNPTLLYLYPVSAAAMLLAVLVDAPVALGAAWALALTVGFFAPEPFAVAAYALAGSTIAALSLGRIERLQTFLWSGAYVALTNAAVTAAFLVMDRNLNWTEWSIALLFALSNGALSGLFALGSLFLLGKLFAITTPLELIDLARPTHPLLQKLLMQAPGTYHHSLIVSHLAEQAAHRIGADALLVRVGAYYHDVGKTFAPPSFVENQLDGVNIHTTLEPQASASMVINHVQNGIALAKKYGLPARIRDFIPQHHGTTLAAYFYRMALKANGGATINENDYRYPGPKPQSREAAILMLADGVEATARAERPHSAEQIRAIIDRIVNERLRDGQLDESDLTLRDIVQVKEAFFGVLQGLFHPRVKYPEPPPENIEQTLDRA